ncbi:apolipoprotein N-acyltransferase [Candidatus Bipolaricaulota bacterium]|nr:apolipoprotein N-acyltransferase [Candidatus Bipolaricaulota bacterium]
MIRRGRWLGALGAAFLLWAAFFRGMGGLAWLSLVPLFWALDGAGLRRGVGLGALFGGVFFLCEFSSLFSLWPFVGPITVLIWVALSLYGALFLTLFGAAGGRWGNPLLWAGGWALIEAARGAGPLGFTFGSIPGALVGSPFLPAVALGGPWLLSLGVAWTAGCLARGVCERRWLPWAVAGPLVLYACALVPTGTGEEGTVTAVLVQPNIPKAEQLDSSRLPERVEAYRRLLEAIDPPVDLILLPENALPWLRDEPERLRPFQEAARRVGATLVVGTADFQEGRIYNTILVVSSQGEIVGTYAKTRLVPFGEYVPWRDFWTGIGLGSLIDPFLPFDQTPGEAVRPVGNLGIMVCFESTFPGISRELVRTGAEVLIVPTNDAWFGRARILWEHYALGALRAAETGRALVQIGQTGISGGWGPRGENLGRLPPWTKGRLTLALPLHSGSTLYVRIGDGPVLGLAAALLLGALTKRPRPGRGRGGRTSG